MVSALSAIVTRLNPSAAETSLVGLVESAGRKRTILDAFEELEAAVPTPENLLLTDQGAKVVDGRWTLLVTRSEALVATAVYPLWFEVVTGSPSV